MKNILVLTDFSAAAMHALDYACYISSQLQTGKIVLYHSSRQPVQDIDAESEQEPLIPVHEWATSQLEKLKVYVATLVNGKVHVDIDKDDIQVDDGINDLCMKHDINVVVMGTSGQSNNAEKKIGSTTAAVIRAAKYPLMVVPPSAPLATIASVLLATDLQEVSKPTEDLLTGLLDMLHPSLQVLNVDRKEKHFGPDSSFELRELHALLERFSPEFIFTEDADTVEGVQRVSTEKNVSLIITIHKHHSWLYNLLYASVSADLALQTDRVLLSLFSE